MPLTSSVSAFIVRVAPSDASDTAMDRAKRSILDGVGLALAGSRSRAAAIACDHVQAENGIPHAQVLGRNLRTTARQAAFLNGVAIHADDYDDTQLAVASDRVYGLLMHPTAPILPVVLALGERDGLSGVDVLMAYLVGVEVSTKIAEAINPRHYEDGFHTTATIGSIGAAAGAARAMGLDASAAATALAIGASQAAGLRENFGTMTKPFHAGRAAESGILAADLAARGFTAAPDILEAPRGFFNAAGGGYSEAAIYGQLGRPWTFESPGVSIKPFPSGSLTHPGMEAMLSLINKHNVTPAEVESVRVGTNRHMPTALIHHQPTDAFQAKFSMEFCMAILILERRAGLAEFRDETVMRPDVQRMIQRVSFDVDGDADAAGFDRMTTIVELDLTDGRTLRQEAAFAKGSPQDPMSDDELIDKFLQNAAWADLDEQRARECAERVLAFEAEPTIHRIIQLLSSTAL